MKEIMGAGYSGFYLGLLGFHHLLPLLQKRCVSCPKIITKIIK